MFSLPSGLRYGVTICLSQQRIGPRIAVRYALTYFVNEAFWYLVTRMGIATVFIPEVDLATRARLLLAGPCHESVE